MQLYLAAAPCCLGNAARWGLPLLHAAYGVEEGRLTSLTLPAHVQGGLLLLTGPENPAVPQPDTLARDILRECLRRTFPWVWDWLRSLPTILESEHLVFVHGGVPSLDRMEELDAWHCMKNDDYWGQGHSFAHTGKYVVVGHWPVTLYDPRIPSAAPIIDRARHIISIDGGCVLKDDGQLNALIIPYNGSEDFQVEHYDPFPVRRVKSAQKGSEKSIYIRWGDNIVRILERGREFSRCVHVRTGYELDILTKNLYGESGEVRCNDCTDYVLPLEAGDEVSVVETTSRGYFVKHNGVSGWYGGELL